MSNKVAASDQELKSLLQFFSDSEVLVSELANGFALSELAEIVKVATDLPSVIQNATIYIPEWVSLTPDQQADLVAFVQANCVFPGNVGASAWIQKVLSAAVMLSSLVQVFVPAAA